jgi:hypothetical protein
MFCGSAVVGLLEPRPHDMPALSFRNNDANVLVVGIDAAGLTRPRVGGHETPHQGWRSRAGGVLKRKVMSTNKRRSSADGSPISRSR